MTGPLDTLSVWKAHGGTQHVVRHFSLATASDMTFSIFLPPQAQNGPCPVVWYLSGLTCTHNNVTEKGEYRRACAELGLIFVAPDTSPRGGAVPDVEDFDLGQGAGFYVDATQPPYDLNYKMRSYVERELPEIVAGAFPIDAGRQAIMGHSMGGHGALTVALRNPGRFRGCSAFSPIVAPSQAPWGQKALAAYLGDPGSQSGAGDAAWREYDAVALIEDGARVDELLVDVGEADQFLGPQLRPDLLSQACAAAGIPLELRIQPGYDHSYYFVSTFMAGHLAWHAERLGR
ncbi:MAG: S-formylglutathione hydrolase [Sphingosinicella sp.]